MPEAQIKDAESFWNSYWEALTRYNTFGGRRCALVIYEGGIGVGKTTLVKETAKYIGPSALPMVEPVPEHGTNPFLNMFYENMERWGFTFQVSQLTPRMEMQLLGQSWALSGRGPGLADRSFYGDTCFMRMLHKAGLVTDMEFAIYKKLYQVMTSFVLLPSICVRLMGSPEVQYERIRRRIEDKPERKGEATITLDYLKNLEDEIAHMCDVLQQQGTEVLTVPYDVEMMSSGEREPLVKNLADRIVNWKPRDSFLDIHRRLVF